MNAEQMWSLFSGKENIASDYEAWAFGDQADTLSRLVLEGVKTATASAYACYEAEGEPLPQAGDYSVILNSKEEAVCVIQNTKVYVTPFSEVSQEHACREGEGDQSLQYWQEVHERFFREELKPLGLDFSENMMVVCEEFVRLYP